MIQSLLLDPRAPDFTLAEASRGVSMTGLQREKANRLAVDVLQPARRAVGAIGINSWCRTPEHNAEVGGAADSLHVQCAGADVNPADVTSKELATWYYLHSEVPVGEVIWYTNTNHLHVTRAPNGGTRQFLVATNGVKGSERTWVPTREDVLSLHRKLGTVAPGSSSSSDTWMPTHPAQVAMDQARGGGDGGAAGGILLVAGMVGLGALFRSSTKKKARGSKRRK